MAAEPLYKVRITRRKFTPPLVHLRLQRLGSQGNPISMQQFHSKEMTIEG